MSGAELIEEAKDHVDQVEKHGVPKHVGFSEDNEGPQGNVEGEVGRGVGGAGQHGGEEDGRGIEATKEADSTVEVDEGGA